MLKSIHQKPPAPRASSIYCRWILDSTGERGAPGCRVDGQRDALF